MKLKQIAAAALVALGAAASLPASAAIGGAPGLTPPELVFVLFDDNRSYTLDLGLSLDAFLAQAATGPLTFTPSDASFTAYLAADTNLFDGTKFDGTRWAVLAVSAEAFGLDQGNQLLSTLEVGQAPTSINNQDWFTGTNVLAAKWADLNQVMNANGSANLDVVTNGNAFSLLGTQGYFNDGGLNSWGGVNYYITNAVGVSSGAYLSDNSNDDQATPIDSMALAGRFLFNGTQLTYTVAAIPEPGSMALLASGLGVLGFIGRRRRNPNA